MMNCYSLTWVRVFLTCWLFASVSFLTTTTAIAQTFGPEGIHMPGEWNGYQNYPDPSTHFAFRGTTTASTTSSAPNFQPGPGGINVAPKALAGSQTVNTTLIHAAASGGDVVAGTYQFKFTTGNPPNNPGANNGNPWGNSWGGKRIVMNTLMTSANGIQYNGGPNDTVTLVNDKFYTVNYKNTGYNNNGGHIFMVTSAAPVAITGTTRSPSAAIITPSTSTNIDVVLASAKSAEERVFIRYSTDGFTTSNMVEASFLSGTTYRGTIPGQPDGTTVSYYTLTTTVNLAAINNNWDSYTLKFNNAGGTTAYTYSVSSVAPVDVVFSVDMANSPVSGGVFLAGSFNGFSISATPMSQVGSTSVYEATVSLTQSTTFQYKFVNGTSFEGNIPAGPCGNGSNRTLTTGTSGETLGTNCFSVCGSCPPQRSVTFTVDMNNELGTTSVNLAGTFNGFSPSALPMTQIGATGVWSVTINLVQGNSYAYKFVKNGANYEPNIPVGPCNTGGQDRTYTVTSSPTQSITSSCFGSCGACTALSFVTFRVDLQYQTVSGTPQIRGSFNGYAGENLTQVGSTSIWQIQKQLAEGSSVTYKFYNGSYEGNTGACFAFGGFGSDRGYTVPTGNVILPVDCYSLCGACPASSAVTFNVNMQGQTVTTGVSVSGSFNGFNTSAHPLSQIGSTGVWTGSALVPSGSAIDYKFVNSGSYESDINGSCKAPFNNNRYQLVGSAPVVVPTACYNRCFDCGASNTWTGAVSQNYADGRNWTVGALVQGATQDIVIGSTGIPMRVADGATVNFRNVAVSGARTINLGPGTVFGVSGTLTGAPTFANGGTLSLLGSGSQTIAASPLASDNLTISSNALLTGVNRVSGTLTLQPGSSLIIPSGLTLTSSATGTARIAPVPSGSTIAGNVTLERWIPSAGWYFVGAPFSSATTLADFNEAGVRVVPKNNANIFRYSENDTTSSRSLGGYIERFGWRVPGALSNSINPGDNPTGYRLYCNSTRFSAGNKLAVTGTPFIGDKSAALTFTPTAPGGWDGGGWNLTANPYASEIDWNAVRLGGANGSAPIGNAITIWQGASANYGTYTALTSTTGTGVGISSQYIASSQAFFVKATAAGSLNFLEAHKSSSNGNSFTREAALDNLLKVRVAQGSNWDEASVLFMHGASVALDNFDAENMTGSAVDVATQPVAGLSCAINVMPTLTARVEVPLTLTTTGTGTTTATFSGVENFTNCNIYLRDNFLGTLTDLAANPAVSFNVSANPATFGNGRFVLVFAPAGVTANHEVVKNTPAMSVWPNPANVETGKLSVGLVNFGGNSAVLTLSDITGKTVITQNIATTGADVNVKGLQAGVYILKVQGAAQTTQQRVVIK